MGRLWIWPVVYVADFCHAGGAVQTYVKGVVQVIGHTRIPSVPKVSKFNEELRAWYYEVRRILGPPACAGS